jgi:hypothetical protein
MVAERSGNSVFMAGYLPTKFNHSQYLLITTRSRDIGEYLVTGRRVLMLVRSPVRKQEIYVEDWQQRTVIEDGD